MSQEPTTGMHAQGARDERAMAKERTRRKARAHGTLYRHDKVWWLRYHIDGRVIAGSLGTTDAAEATRIRDQLAGQPSEATKPEPHPIERYPLTLFQRKDRWYLGYHGPGDKLRVRLPVTSQHAALELMAHILASTFGQWERSPDNHKKQRQGGEPR